MENNKFPLYKNILFDLNCQYRAEDNLNSREEDLFENLNGDDEYFNQSYVELNGETESLDNSNVNTSAPYINPNFNDDIYKNGDSFLNTTINYLDYETEDDNSQVEDSEIHYLNFIRKSEIAVSQQNTFLNHDESDCQQENTLKTYTIVCIDDSRAVVNAIKMYLDDKIFSVVGIHDSLKALMQIVRLKPDVILLDINMPTLNGYELCSLLRKHSSLKETPIVMVTGKKGIINRFKAKMVKASDYLTKPFQKKDLLKVIFKHIV